MVFLSVCYLFALLQLLSLLLLFRKEKRDEDEDEGGTFYFLRKHNAQQLVAIHFILSCRQQPAAAAIKQLTVKRERERE